MGKGVKVDGEDGGISKVQGNDVKKVVKAVLLYGR